MDKILSDFNFLRVWHICRRELRGYFFSPMAYVVAFVFWVFSGVFFWSSFFLQGQADLRNYFSMLPWMLTFIVPAVTMRLLAEEKSSGSYEVLLTLPVTIFEVVFAKFLSASLFCAFILLLVPLYGLSVSALGDLDWGPIIGGFVGAIFLASFYSALGLFASSFSKNQIIAFLGGVVLCLVFFIVDKFLFFLPDFFLSVVHYISSDYHFKNIAKGMLDSRDLGFFLSGIALFLMFTQYVLRRQFVGR